MIKQQRHQGMTLIEILISMVIGAFLIGGILQIFLNSKQTYRMQENLSRMQENGRFALDFISRDVRMAGYFGCFSGPFSAPQFENALKDQSNPGWDASISIIGYDDVTSSFSIFNNVVSNTDVVIIRSLSSSSAPLVYPYSDSAQMFVDPAFNNDCPTSTPNTCHTGEILMVTDCSQATLFQATNITLAGGKLNIVHSANNTFTPGNSAPPIFSKSYGSGSKIVKLNTFGYYIRINPNNQPSLYRSRLNLTNNKTNALLAEELIEGIENMQILYGVDTDNDDVANYYVDAATVPDWSQVISVKVKLLVVSPDDNLTAQPASYSFNGTTSTPTDRRLRREFSSTIVLRNRLP